MRLLITTPTGDTAPVDVPEEMELENLVALIQVEFPVFATLPMDRMLLLHNGKPLADGKKTLKQHGIKNDDMVLVSPQPQLPLPPINPAARAAPQQRTNSNVPQIDFGSVQIPGSSRPARARASNSGSSRGQGGSAGGLAADDPARVREMMLADPALLATLRHNNPPLAEALDSGDFDKFAKILKEQSEHRQQQELERIRAFNADPFDIEAQKYIENAINSENIESNFGQAIEHTPENFGVVAMLYIRMIVNGHEIKAFVDSGAQSTIMSVACAKRCNIMRLVDKRFSGIAKGVGTQRIIGRIHLAQIQIENDNLPTSFTVLEDQSMDILLGLDMLKRHQCVIDLAKNVLVIGTTRTVTHFLPESELPAHARLNGNDPSPEDQDKELAEAMQKSANEAAGDSVMDTSPSTSSTKRKHSASGGSLTSTSANGTTASNSGSGADAAAIQKITDMGFEREAAERELRSSDGDINTAIAALIARSFPKPPTASK